MNATVCETLLCKVKVKVAALPLLSQINLAMPAVHEDEETQLPPFKEQTKVKLKDVSERRLRWLKPLLLCL